MEELPELIAICYDEEHMCTKLHSDTSGKRHPEEPKRLEAILDRIRSSTISLDGYGEFHLMDFTRHYDCTPVEDNILYYCHSQRHVQKLMRCCKDIAKLNDEYTPRSTDTNNEPLFVCRYPFDQDTYLTSMSETVARLAVGGIVMLTNILMGIDLEDSAELPAESPSIPAKLRGLDDLLENSDSEADSFEFEAGDNVSNILYKTLDSTRLDGTNNNDSYLPLMRAFGSADVSRVLETQEKSLVRRILSMDNLITNMHLLSLKGRIEFPTTSVRKGFALVRPPGHHATRDKALGFCLYNNVAIAAVHLQRTFGLQRIAIVDIDVHHGNGTQDIFYNDEGVCFISIHRFGTDNNPFYPYSGNTDEVGGAEAEGYNVNIPLSAGYTTHDFVYASKMVVLPKLETFKPEFILVSCGFDAAKNDFLGGCEVTPEGYAWLVLELCKVAERYSNGRLLLALEGGYNPKVNADCTEKILKTIINYEVDRSFTIPIKYDSSKVKKSTIKICSYFKGFIKNSIIPPRIVPEDKAIYDEYNKRTPLRWKSYTDNLEENSFVLAGGHLNQFIVSSDLPREEICKLCSPKEIKFYRWLYSINGKDIDIIDKPYSLMTLPFSGVGEKTCITAVRLVSDPSIAPKVKKRENEPDCLSPLPEVEGNLDEVKKLIDFILGCTGVYTGEVFSGWDLEHSHKTGIRLRNALYNMNEPCIMDLKMGTRLYGDDLVDPVVIEQKELKASMRSSKSHGFHLSGMLRWVRRKCKAAYLEENVARMLKTDDDMVSAFALYFNRIPYKEVAFQVIDKLIEKLTRLQSLFENQKQLAFYGTNLLFVFDAYTKSHEETVNSADVHIIDLSHVSYNTGCTDAGYLLGLRTLIILLKETKKAIKDKKKYSVF
ncbi:ureohydrolase domain containing protein [Babesia gibsoni]|uniref:histone deacetylase n=1 Tax=Babesia gibsoni TaxID=33632 RepID=A0AAD8PF60_BABGI|nr:ureohydrolase domain containing protein [Babesia gibsoni]